MGRRLGTGPSEGNTDTHRTNNYVHIHSHLRATLFLDCGRKPEYPVRTCKPMQKDPRPEVEPPTVLLQGNSPTNYAPMQTISTGPYVKNILTMLIFFFFPHTG
ncbi:hypothetical protein AMECASPLE_011831 [Ameca splendens]|uniref:Uncharacterized protein n=1 Tax=Ameca splendens TaxID=208324 RepID=A0ABV0YBY1_9TELE